DAAGNVLIASHTALDTELTTPQVSEVRRLTPEGFVDGSFGAGGVMTIPLGPESSVASIVFDENGNIIMGGSRPYAYKTVHRDEWVLGRFDSSGRPDPTFGDGGLTVQRFPNRRAFITATALAPDGTVLVGGRLN